MKRQPSFNNFIESKCVNILTQSKFYICKECMRYLRKDKIVHVSEGTIQIESISI